MKCPNCDFIDKDEAFGDPATCPKCEAIYEKALRTRALREEFESQRAAQKRHEPEDDGVTLKDRFSSMTAKSEERRKRREAYAVERGVQMEKKKVIVSDIDMPFWSMVRFMVKWAIASIPAIFILAMIAAYSFYFLLELLR